MNPVAGDVATHVVPGEIRYPALEHMKEVERTLRPIKQLSRGPASCDHRLIQNYALYAPARVRAAARTTSAERREGSKST